MAGFGAALVRHRLAECAFGAEHLRKYPGKKCYVAGNHLVNWGIGDNNRSCDCLSDRL